MLDQDKLYVGSASIIAIASATAYSNNLLVSSIEERELMICIVTSLLIPSKSLTYSRTTPSVTGVPNLQISHYSQSLYLAQPLGLEYLTSPWIDAREDTIIIMSYKLIHDPIYDKLHAQKLHG